jgi:membrane protein DedA with SNARE-associated domain
VGFEALLARFGLLAVFAGTFVEGETVLVLAGFAARRGYLDLPDVLLAGFLGTLLGDQLWFLLGRTRGRQVLARRPAWHARVERAHAWIVDHQGAVLWTFRFLYGLRTVAPFVLGMSGVRPLRFAAYNLLTAAVWTLAIGGAGYALGTALEELLGDLRRLEGLVFLAIAATGALLWLRYGRRSRMPQEPPTAPRPPGPGS